MTTTVRRMRAKIPGLGDGAIFDQCLIVADATGAGHGLGVDAFGQGVGLMSELGSVVGHSADGVDRYERGPWREEGVFEAEVGDFGGGVFFFAELGIVGEVPDALASPEGTQGRVGEAGFGGGFGEVEALAPSLAAASESGEGDFSFGLAGPLGSEERGRLAKRSRTWAGSKSVMRASVVVTLILVRTGEEM